MTDKLKIKQTVPKVAKEKKEEKEPESKPEVEVPKTEEVFGGDLDLAKIGEGDELKLFSQEKWTFWEFREFQDKQKTDKNIQEAQYEKSLKKVGWFDNILQFHQVWNKFPHARIKDVLADSEKN